MLVLKNQSFYFFQNLIIKLTDTSVISWTKTVLHTYGTIAQSLVSCVIFCRSLFPLFPITLSVIVWFTVFGYPFGICKLFSLKHFLHFFFFFLLLHLLNVKDYIQVVPPQLQHMVFRMDFWKEIGVLRNQSGYLKDDLDKNLGI